MGEWERGQWGKAEQLHIWLSTKLLSRAAKNLLPREKIRMRAPLRREGSRIEDTSEPGLRWRVRD